MKVKLSFAKGTILIRGDVSTPFGRWDPRSNCYRALGCYYQNILDYLNENNVHVEDLVLDLPPKQPLEKGRITLYPFQEEALKKWIQNRKRGVLCIATAGGKSFIGLKAIEILEVPTLIVVPTLDLVDQWVQRVRDTFGIEVGVIGGGKHDVKFITVTTYDSAYIHAESIGNRFLFLILDEVHHAFAPGYVQILELFVAPYRMGLTSTLYRPDMRHLQYLHLVGGVVYEAPPEKLTGKYLAPYVHEKIFVELTPEEKKFYDEQYGIFKSYLAREGITLKSPADFQKLIIRSSYDPEAREAILARNRAFKTALNSEAKLQFLAKILSKTSEKTIIFTLHNDLVYRISKKFLIPAITYKTPLKERREILRKFKQGEYKVIVTSQVLDEGVDVPDASLGIILSGTGSPREFVQRLGRLLRKREGKVARLIEVISKETSEMRLSRRRHKKVKYNVAE